MVSRTDSPQVSDDRTAVTLRLPPAASRLSELRRWLEDSLDSVSTRPRCEGVLVLIDDSPEVRVGGAAVAETSRWEKALRRLENLPVPVVGAVTGGVDGAGFGLLLALDLVVVAPSVVLSCRELTAGTLPGMTLHRLAKYVGLGNAKHIVFTGRAVPASEAHRLGLVAGVSAQPRETAEALLAAPPAPGTAVWQLSRRLLGESYWNSPEDALGGALAAQDRVLREREGRS